MGEEGGWAVPVSYGYPLDEARTIRSRAGVFDLSHLGRIRIRGNGALELLERVCTADVAHQEDNTAMHTLLCNEAGGILDEAFLLRLESMWVLTTNAANREKLLAHLKNQDVVGAKIDDQTAKVSQIAVAGPAAEKILGAVLPIPVTGLARGEAKMGSLMIANYIASRSGYCGQWMLEVMVPGMFAGKAWAYITQKAGENAIAPCGMAARDILRIESGLCRYGHEVNETIDPITAGLGGCVDFDHDFIGAAAVEKISQAGPTRRRVSLVLDTPCGDDTGQTVDVEAIPRLGAAITRTDGGEIGTVTSGTFSPHLRKIIAMGYVAASHAETDAEVLIGSQPARITKVAGQI